MVDFVWVAALLILQNSGKSLLVAGLGLGGFVNLWFSYFRKKGYCSRMTMVSQGRANWFRVTKRYEEMKLESLCKLWILHEKCLWIVTKISKRREERREKDKRIIRPICLNTEHLIFHWETLSILRVHWAHICMRTLVLAVLVLVVRMVTTKLLYLRSQPKLKIVFTQTIYWTSHAGPIE